MTWPTTKPTAPKTTTPKTTMLNPTTPKTTSKPTWLTWPTSQTPIWQTNTTDLDTFAKNTTSDVVTNNDIIWLIMHLPTFFKDWFDNLCIIVSSVVGFFLMILFGYGLFACFMTSIGHANKKMRFPRNDYRYLPSCLRKKLGERRDTIISYPSTRSGLDRLEQAKLDQEMRREKIRLGEPLYEKVPLKGFAKWKKKFSKKKPVSIQTELHVVQVHAPEMSQPKIKQVSKVSKLKSLFSKKTPPTDYAQLKTYDNYLTKALELEKAYKTRPKKTTGVHKPFSLTPSFVFGTGVEPAYDSFPLATWSRPNTTLKIAQSALDSGDVVLGFSNETYEAPTFETFRPVKPVSQPDPDMIELAPNQPNPGDVVLGFSNETYGAPTFQTCRPVKPVSQPDPDMIELAPNQPDPDLIELAPNQPDEQVTFF